MILLEIVIWTSFLIFLNSCKVKLMFKIRSQTLVAVFYIYFVLWKITISPLPHNRMPRLHLGIRSVRKKKETERMRGGLTECFDCGGLISIADSIMSYLIGN